PNPSPGTLGTTSVDLSLTKTATPATGTVGAIDTYTIRVPRNLPSFPTRRSSDLDVLPANATFVSASNTTTSTTLTPTGNVLTDNNRNMTRRTSKTITVADTPTTADAITDSASVEGGQVDLNQANNAASVTTPVQG